MLTFKMTDLPVASQAGDEGQQRADGEEVAPVQIEDLRGRRRHAHAIPFALNHGESPMAYIGAQSSCHDPPPMFVLYGESPME